LSLRESVLEEFAGDLEYNPRRAAIYFALAAAAFSFWYFTPAENKFTSTPIIFALGSLTLLLKAIFLCRRSSEGLGLSQHEIEALSSAAGRKALPQIPAQAAQVVQDFGAGSLLFWVLLPLGKDVDASWTYPPVLPVVLSGGILFGLGWLIRRLTRVNSITNP
jgi:hypothetical protein